MVFRDRSEGDWRYRFRFNLKSLAEGIWHLGTECAMLNIVKYKIQVSSKDNFKIKRLVDSTQQLILYN